MITNKKVIFLSHLLTISSMEGYGKGTPGDNSVISSGEKLLSLCLFKILSRDVVEADRIIFVTVLIKGSLCSLLLRDEVGGKFANCVMAFDNKSFFGTKFEDAVKVGCKIQVSTFDIRSCEILALRLNCEDMAAVGGKGLHITLEFECCWAEVTVAKGANGLLPPGKKEF